MKSNDIIIPISSSTKNCWLFTKIASIRLIFKGDKFYYFKNNLERPEQPVFFTLKQVLVVLCLTIFLVSLEIMVLVFFVLDHT